jgi:hypothetical protein
MKTYGRIVSWENFIYTFGMLKPEVFRDEGFIENNRIGASQASSKRGTCLL